MSDESGPPSWFRKLTLELFKAEATQLISGDAQSARTELETGLVELIRRKRQRLE